MLTWKLIEWCFLLSVVTNSVLYQFFRWNVFLWQFWWHALVSFSWDVLFKSATFLYQVSWAYHNPITHTGLQHNLYIFTPKSYNSPSILISLFFSWHICGKYIWYWSIKQILWTHIIFRTMVFFALICQIISMRKPTFFSIFA